VEIGQVHARELFQSWLMGLHGIELCLVLWSKAAFDNPLISPVGQRDSILQPNRYERQDKGRIRW